MKSTLQEKISDKIICVSGETIFAYGAPEQIFREETIRSLYHIDNGYFDPVFGVSSCRGRRESRASL